MKKLTQSEKAIQLVKDEVYNQSLKLGGGHPLMYEFISCMLDNLSEAEDALEDKDYAIALSYVTAATAGGMRCIEQHINHFGQSL